MHTQIDVRLHRQRKIDKPLHLHVEEYFLFSFLSKGIFKDKSESTKVYITNTIQIYVISVR